MLELASITSFTSPLKPKLSWATLDPVATLLFTVTGVTAEGTEVSSQPGLVASASRLKLAALRVRSPVASRLPLLLTFRAPEVVRLRLAELVSSPVIVTVPWKLSVGVAPVVVGLRSRKPLSVRLPLLGRLRLEVVRMARRRSVRVRSISRVLLEGVERLVEPVESQASFSTLRSPLLAEAERVWVWMLPLIAIVPPLRVTAEVPRSTCGEKVAKVPVVIEDARLRARAVPAVASAAVPANLKVLVPVLIT